MVNWKSGEKQNVFLKLLLCTAVMCIAGMFLMGKYNTGYLENDNASETASSADKIHATALIKDETGILTEKQSVLLEEHARLYGQTLSSLETADFSALYTDSTGEDYYKNLSAYEILTGVRKMSHLDMKLESAAVEYYVKEVSDGKNGTVVHIQENNEQQFRHLSQPSGSYNINHLFVLQESEGEWYIKSHRQEEDFFLLAMEAWENAGGSDYAQRAENTVNIIIADARENKDALKISTGNPPEAIEVGDTSYDRDAAVEYARQWCNQRNYTGNYLAYDDYGGNCQNFASQCIYAGGMNMDYSGYGESQWKFYSRTQNNRQTPSGRSYSWTGVDPFYTYASINRSGGLVCQADLRLEYAEKGDVVQVGAYHDWRHSLVVTDVMYNRDGSLMDIIVASNTADRWNYPLSAYIYTYPRLIHILGQN